jgi:hypothetical protein
MRRKLIVFCETCGSDTPSCTAEFIVYHHLSFCSPDCRDEYRAADEDRRAQGSPAGARVA